MPEQSESQLGFGTLLPAIDTHAPPEIAATFRPPADAASTARIEQLLGMPLPECLRQLLLWHDGQEWNSPLRESDNRRLLSSGAICETLAFFLNPGEDFLQPWGCCWVPFLTNDSGDSMRSSTRNGEAIEYWHDMDDRNVSYPCLAEWAMGLIDEFRRGDA